MVTLEVEAIRFWKTRGKAALLGLFLGCVIFLTGCANFGIQKMEDLLRAPALGEDQGEVQQALRDYLGEDPEYKFPKEGDQRSPIVMYDLDGDGTDEAVVLYGLPSGSTGGSSEVYLTVLQKREDEWTVQEPMTGEGVEVASFEVAGLLGDGSRQVLVGYGNSPTLDSKVLAVYDFRDGRLQPPERLTSYSRYELADFTGRGGSDLVIIRPYDQSSGLQLLYVPVVDGRLNYDIAQAQVQLGGQGTKLVSCVGLYPSVSNTGERLIVADCLDGNTMLASQILYYSGEEWFYNSPNPETLVGDTARRYPLLLRARDIDGDRVVEIPQQVSGEVVTLNGDKTLEFVEWIDFTGETQLRKQFGILDADRGVYIRLPDSWLEEAEGAKTVRVRVVDGSGEGEWALEDVNTGRRFLNVRVYESGAPENEKSAKLISEASGTWLEPTVSIPQHEWESIEIVKLS